MYKLQIVYNNFLITYYYYIYFILAGSFHRASIASIGAQKKGTNICASLSVSKTKEMKEARSALLKIISSLLYLSRQGLAIRGHVDISSNSTITYSTRRRCSRVKKLAFKNKV